MSGPSTRSHRSSVRGVETTLAELSDLLMANKSVVIITGAGLSAASGIPTFRGGSDSVWSVTAAAQGRRSVFRRDPLRWYNEFFLRHFPMSFTRKTPNAGHEALAALAREFPQLRVITQNIDGLHQDTVNVWPDPDRLIEAHGRLGLFKCIAENDAVQDNDDDDDDDGGSRDGRGDGDGANDKTNGGSEGNGEPNKGVQDDDDGEGSDEEDDCCPYSFDKEIKPEELQESVRGVLRGDDAQIAAARGLGSSLSEVPRCPGCGEASSPMSLLFDEDYDSHSFYDFEKAEDWFKEADAIVFVGTSFAVTLTSLAIREAKRRGVPVFDFNVSVSLKSSPALDAKTILGRAEVTLPALARAAGVTLATIDGGGGGIRGGGNRSDGGSGSPLPDVAVAGAAAAEEEEEEEARAAGMVSVRGGSDGSSNTDGGGSSFYGRVSPEVTGLAAAVTLGSALGRGNGGREPTPEPTTSGDDNSDSPLGRRPRDGNFGGGGGSGSGSGGEESGGDADALPPGEEELAEGPVGDRISKRARRIPSTAVGGSGGRAAAAANDSGVPREEEEEEEAVWGGGAAYLLEPALETPLGKEQVRVDLDEAYSRKPHPDPEIEATIETLWQEQLAKNPLLFNGSKFRLAGYSTEGDYRARGTAAAAAASDTADSSDGGGGRGGGGGGGVQGRTTPPPLPRSRSPTSPPTKKLRLRLGLTDYRTFRGTNWSPSAARLAADSARDHPWLEGAYLSQKLGVGAVVETSDGFLLSLCRSSGVAEGQGMMGAPGGHPEPENIGLTAEVLRGLSTKTVSSRRKVGLQATDELFDSAVQEVVDETNLPRSALGEPLLSGLVRQGNSFGAPTAAFIIPCSLDRAEASALYAKGAKEAFESTALRTLPASEVVAEGGSAWFVNRGLTATPSFQGALELWREYRLRNPEGEGGGTGAGRRDGEDAR